MAISKIEISGLRGFATAETIHFAIPNGNFGSGLTIIVGPNNSGKSTITEAINVFTSREPPSLAEGKRNSTTHKHVEIKLSNQEGQAIVFKTASSRGSETVFHDLGMGRHTIKPFIIPSRRMFSPFFAKGARNRDAHIAGQSLPPQRGQGYNEFPTRLFTIQANQQEFNEVLTKVIGKCPEWYIEQNDTGNYYLKFTYDQTEHNSDGAGEGLLSIFTIVDALYDSVAGDLIVIDEPELSVHPSFQKKLIGLLSEYATDRQIIISTHSPYFINWGSIVNGGAIVRVIKENNSSKIYQLSPASVDAIGNALKGLNNPHTFGLVASEVFFLEENIVLVEGQEDVIIYQEILKTLGIQLVGDFYGWGVGGADNMKNIVRILNDLGFKKVVGILDKNKMNLAPQLSKDFPDYLFIGIPADDVRDKNAIKGRPGVSGLASTDGTVKDEYKGVVTQIFSDVNSFFIGNRTEQVLKKPIKGSST